MNTPFNMGLIGMGGAMLRPGGTLGDGFLAFQQGLNQGQRNDLLMRQDSRQDALFGLQAQKHQAELDAAARKQKLLEQINNDIAPLGAPTTVRKGPDVTNELRALMQAGKSGGELGSGTYGINVHPAIDPLPRMAQRQSFPQFGGPGQWTPQLALKMLMAGFSPADISTVAGAGDLGRSKVARTVEFAGPDGMPMIAQVDDYGRMVGQPMPKPVELGLEDFGATKRPYNKYTGTTQGSAFDKALTPGEQDASSRGWATIKETGRHNRAIEATAAQNAANPRGVPVVTADGQTILVDPRSAQAVPVTMGGQTVRQGPAAVAEDNRIREAKDVLSLLNEAEPLIDKSTGSYSGAGIDQAARIFGASTPGANAAAQLKAIQGALVSKMPKMTGPQSDKDVLLYREMAGQIGDPTIPAPQKKAAMATIRALNEKYAGMEPGASRSNRGATGSWGGSTNRPPLTEFFQQ